MGSRSRRYAALAAVLAGSGLAGCSVGAPTGFSEGHSWSIPLIGPLEDGQLLVPVFVNGKGPYVFAIDTDAPTSIVDDHLVKEAGLRVGQGADQLDESDTKRVRFFAEAVGIELGNLTIERRSAEVVNDHTFDLDGRQIDGVIGRDIIADSLGFAFDRDRGLITLMTQKDIEGMQAAFGGAPTKYEVVSAQIMNVNNQMAPRRLVKAAINGVPFTLHVDFGATASQLRDRSWAKAKLATTQGTGGVVDEVGTPRAIDHLGKAETVTLGGITAHDVDFVPYGDKRFHDEDYEGSLGLGFFHGQSVLVNWDKDTFFTKPRGNLLATVADRTGRWQKLLMPKCAEPGCATASLVDPLAATPPEQRPAQHPGVLVTVARDPAAQNVALEVLIQVTAPGGEVKWLVANLPANADRAMTHLPASFVGATLALVDASPFPRSCPGDGGCIDTLRTPAEARGAAAAPVAPAPPDPAAPTPIATP